MSHENGGEVFKKSFRGYNTFEVDEYIDGIKKDVDTLKSECADLYGKLKDAEEQIERYRRREEVQGDIINDAKSKADKIVNDAKGRAARVIIRTSRQCNRIVADMVSQVEEQKNIYDTAKKEVLKFREDLFAMYKDHIRKINAYSEAAGAFETDALSQSELDSYMDLLGNEDFRADEEEAVTTIGDEIEEKVNRIKKEAAATAEQILKSKSAAQETSEPEPVEPEVSEEGGELTFGETEAVDAAPFEEGTPDEKESSDGAYEVPVTEEKDETPDEGGDFRFGVEGDISDGIDETDHEIPDIRIDEEDIDEFEKDGPRGDVVNEFDGPVSLNDVFGTIDSYKNADLEAVYGEAEFVETEDEEQKQKEEEILERRRHADDDSNEFYSEDDAEFDPNVAPAEPTAEIGSIGESVEEAPRRKRRWKLKRSMSITDEFKAVKPDGEND